ncbi:glycosyltransferase [Salipaludibacillus sp. CUR1]|uniref:glycosyltransferase n=1 Tax=Salipaludibacillus sp. CUR1 TaxID=2820003 RepID=UPI001E41B7A8|nr:glycosyltransferase family 2 protein [Salipaludibacillus sp. CUR1]MCE7790965.1 glycosyltransferase [Salipaludibacillus sp. CUR1]
MVYLAAVTCLFWLLVLIDAFTGMRKMPKLENIQENDQLLREGPLVSVIVAAKDEESHIGESLRSQFKQTYPHLEWLVVNDRSEDRTGDIIEELGKEDARMTPIHIEKLEEGWLGKNHALYKGYLEAKGEYLLFTDADVIYKPEALAKAMSYAVEHEVDHLTLAPDMNVKKYWASAFVSFFMFGFSYFKRPWKTNDDKSKHALGIGAFNLLKREAYEDIGTHQKIRMRPDDDLMLGVHIKQSGKKQRVGFALSHLEVEWYSSLRAAISGLEKNTFAGLYYSYLMVLVSLSGIFISQLFPFIALFVTEGMTLWLYAGAVILMFLVYLQTSFRRVRESVKHFAVFPVTTVLFMYTIIRAVTLTTVRGGITWRGTFYPLETLKNKK